MGENRGGAYYILLVGKGIAISDEINTIRRSCSSGARWLLVGCACRQSQQVP